MARTAEVGVLNIAASPHDESTYEVLLNRVAHTPVKFRGNDFAAITPPVDAGDGVFEGRVFVWTEIDPSQPIIDTDKLDEKTFEDLRISLPQNAGFNGKIFFYIFRRRDHRVFVELRNEFRKTLSVKQYSRVFEKLMSEEILGTDAPHVEVTVVPEEDALERLLKIPDIRMIRITLKRPNPDHVSAEDVREILNELQELGARDQRIVFRKDSHEDTLRLNKRYRQIAGVATENGSVEVEGRDNKGEKFSGSTKSYPKIIRRVIDAATSARDVFVAMIRSE